MSQYLADKFGIPLSLLDATKGVLSESDAYQAKVKAHMAKKGIKSLNDLTGDQKKKFFNDLDAMHTAKHEEVEQVEEGSGPKEKQKTPYRDINSPASRAAADKRREEMDKEEKSEKGKKLLGKIAAKNEDVEPVAEGSGETPTINTCKKCGKKWKWEHYCKGAPNKKQGAAGEFKGELDSKGRFTKDTVQTMFGKLSPDAKTIKEQGVAEASQKDKNGDGDKPFNYDEWKTSGKKPRGLPGWGPNGFSTKLFKDTAKDKKDKQKDVAESQLDELSTSTLKSYHKKAVDKLIKGDVPLNKFDKRETGAMRAYKKAYNQKGVAEEIAPVEEELKGEMHPDAHKVLKHIKPEHHGVYKPYLKKGVYNGSYRDRADVLSAAEKSGHLKEEVELVEKLLAKHGDVEVHSTSSSGEGSVVSVRKKGKEIATGDYDRYADTYWISHPSFGKGDKSFGVSSDVAKHFANMKEEVELTQEDIDFIASLNQIKYQGTSEDFTLEDFTVEEIEEYMQTEDYDQLDELSKETLGSYIKKRQHDVATQGALTRQHTVDAEKAKKDHNYTQQRKSNEKSDKAFAKGWKYRQNISKAVDKIVKKA